MKITDLLPKFKRYALIERGITSGSVKEILSIVSLMTKESEIKTLNKADTSSVRDFLYDQKEKRLWVARTFRNKRQYLKSFFDFCIRHDYLKINPVDKIAKPKIPKSLPRCLKVEDVDKILMSVDTMEWSTAIEKKRNQAMIRTFLLTGIRLQELVDLKSISVQLSESKIYIKNGKGGKDRVIPIHPKLRNYLIDYSNRKKLPTAYFFSSVKSDSRLTKKNIYAVLEKIKVHSNVYFSPHMFRHTFGRMAIEANLNPFMLQSILGHSDISTTQIYVSLSRRSTKDSFQKLDLL